MMSRSAFYAVIAGAILLGLLFSQPSQCQTCYCTGDVDGDGIALQAADLSYLTAFVNFAGPPPSPIYQGDLDGDSTIDQADIEKFQCYFAYGMSCFPTYPVPTCSEPDTIRGACCDSSVGCHVRSFANCKKGGGYSELHGTDCDGCTHCAHPPTGLVAWYPLDETFLSSTRDIAGSLHGQILSSPGVSPGMVGNAFSFSCVNQGTIRVRPDPFTKIGGDFTIDAWIRPGFFEAGCSYSFIRPIIDNSNPEGIVCDPGHG